MVSEPYKLDNESLECYGCIEVHFYFYAVCASNTDICFLLYYRAWLSRQRECDGLDQQETKEKLLPSWFPRYEGTVTHIARSSSRMPSTTQGYVRCLGQLDPLISHPSNTLGISWTLSAQRLWAVFIDTARACTKTERTVVIASSKIIKYPVHGILDRCRQIQTWHE